MYTLEKLKKISETTGIPLKTLQQEYGVYEFTFTTSKEAAHGYKSKWNKPVSGFTDPEILAYHAAWKQASLVEVPDVTVLRHEQALLFLATCYPEGRQFVDLISVVKKTTGDDITKIAIVVKATYAGTFYSPEDCPLKSLRKRLMEKVELHYAKRIKEARHMHQLLEIDIEEKVYKFGDIRPFPEFFELLWQKKAKLCRTINDLVGIKFFHGHGLARWEELYPKAKLDDILPSLEDFLKAMRQDDRSYCEFIWQSPVYQKIEHFFQRCQTDKQARWLLDIARNFYSDEKDPMFELYMPVNARIFRKKFPNPKLHEFENLLSSVWDKQYRIQLEESWLRKSKKALTQPIPNFAKLYRSLHTTFQPALLSLESMGY